VWQAFRQQKWRNGCVFSYGRLIGKTSENLVVSQFEILKGVRFRAGHTEHIAGKPLWKMRRLV
jgi:hypothetical protein